MAERIMVDFWLTDVNDPVRLDGVEFGDVITGSLLDGRPYSLYRSDVRRQRLVLRAGKARAQWRKGQRRG